MGGWKCLLCAMPGGDLLGLILAARVGKLRLMQLGVLGHGRMFYLVPVWIVAQHHALGIGTMKIGTRKTHSDITLFFCVGVATCAVTQ